MRLKFLCKTHRHALLEDTEAARSLWLGLQAQLNDAPAVATPQRVRQAGTALEAAGIYLLAKPAADAALLQRYVTSAQHLIELLVQLRQTRLAIVVVAGTNALVEHLARSGADRDAALAACRRLTLQGMEQVEGAHRRGQPAGALTPSPATVATLH